MRRPMRGALALFPLVTTFVTLAFGQAPMTWEEVRERFRHNNPSLLAGATGIEESRANEITAGLRPNLQLSLTMDQWTPFHSEPFQPFAISQTIPVISQLIERRQKRHLRVESARAATSIATTDLADLNRQLEFALRDAFIRTLQSKSVLELAAANLEYYERVVELNRKRFEAGDLSRADFDRVELLRAQFEADVQNAGINLRTAKIQLLSMMDDHRAVDAFDVTGPFEFKESILDLADLRQVALESRGDIRSADAAIRKAEVDHRLAVANGSTDPVVGLEYARVGPANTIGVDVTIPLRIFDRNQGEKQRTSLEMQRTGQLRRAIVNAAMRDIDSAYAQVESIRTLLRPYRERYLPQAARVRDSVSFAYSRGAASLLEFVDAQKAYRDTELNYRNLIASYLSAANQLNLAVGREVLP